jgi:asparagine synthase (glutamine-hydrolysing)
MTALDVAVGAPIGFGPDVRLPSVTTAPLVALEEAVAAAVRRTPCCVAFSGGRDSSLVLAAAVRAAAKEYCPQPIALTVRFRGESASDESAWQDLVLDHLGVTDRIVLDVDDELDLVGPVATRELHRRGALFPANSHGLAPLVEHASGGSLLVGLGGDELLSGHRWTRVNDVLAGRQRPGPRDVGRIVVATLPGMLRARVLRSRRQLEPPRWLRSAAAQRLRRIERAGPDEPVRFDRVVPHAARARTVLVAAESLKRLSGDVSIEAPLLDPRFVAALASAGGARGWGGRAAAMRAIVGDALPDAILGRRDKAHFDATYFGAATRRFAKTWTGGGIDPSLVDPDALRSEWLEPKPDFRSALLLQIAWLHDHGLTPDGLPRRES